MKNILKGISGLFFLMMIIISCSPDSVDHPSESGMPKISDINVKIIVGDKNVVTFEIENEEVVPIWYLESGAVFGNGYQKTFRFADTYSVEVKVYNKNGISDGSVVEEFTIQDSYLPDINDSEQLNIISGGGSKTWIWDSMTYGHIGCGEPNTNGLNWWAAGPNEKADFGMYDDLLTFTINRGYIFDPGPDGLIYVNGDSGYKPEYNTGDGDYDVPCEVKKDYYWFEQDGDDLYLVFDGAAILSYIPNTDALKNPRYKVLTLTNDLLELVITNADISWHYQFIPKKD